MGPQALSPAGGNELAPQGAPAGSPEDGLLGWLQAAHDQTASRFAKLQEADARLRAVRMAMDELVKLGDTVDQEDVVKAAGELVKAGLGAAPIASMLADMPEQGEALQAWIAQQDQQVRAREQQLSVVTGLARHQMGVSALRVLTGHAIAGQAGAGLGLSGRRAPRPC